MSLYMFLSILLIFSFVNGDDLKIGFMLFPAIPKSELSRAVFDRYFSKWQSDNPDMSFTIVDKNKKEFTMNSNADTVKQYIETEKVKILFGFCYGINKIGDYTLDEYMKKNNAYIFCASTQDNACTTNVVNVQDGGIYYSRAFLYLATKWKKFVIVGQPSIIALIKVQLDGICSTEKCQIIKEVDTNSNSLKTDISGITDNNFAIIINTSPDKNTNIYAAVADLKSAGKTVEAYGFGNIELTDVATTSNSEDTQMISLISDFYTSEKKTEMDNLMSEVAADSSLSLTLKTPFQYLYLMYI